MALHHLLLLLLPAHALRLPPTTATLTPHPSAHAPAPAPPPLPAHFPDLTTADDLLNRHCGDILLLFARGTGNPGNLGATLGPPLLHSLRTGLAPRSVAAQGVLPYPARALGYLQGGSREGADSMVALTYLARCVCPSSVLVLAGFSQGAQVLRKAVGELPAALAARVAAVLSFSDSMWPAPLPAPWHEKHISLCRGGDWVCDGAYSALTGRHGSELYLPFLGLVVEQLAVRIANVTVVAGDGGEAYCGLRGALGGDRVEYVYSSLGGMEDGRWPWAGGLAR